MSTPLYPEYEYQVGGSLRVNAPSYVVRQADQILYQVLRAGQFCYVLNCRQMGKSSLRVRIMHRLKAEGMHCIAINMTRIGSEHITPQQWYEQIISELWRGANLLEQVNLKAWFQKHPDLVSVQLLARFIEEVLLVHLKGRIIIFIDEIDSILSLSFSINDFFAFIRSCYNQRVDNPVYERLTFCLLGVATPSDLMSDKTRTPFNIGRAIALNGFQFSEARSLAIGLTSKVPDPEAALREILHWTGGQPFLTQKICQLVTEPNASSVAQSIRNFINNWSSEDEPEHLRTIRDRLLRQDKLAGRLLGLYRQILQQGEILAEDSKAHQELRMSGLVVKQGAVLKVYNPIYAAVFNLKWVENMLDNLRPYAAAFNAWIASNKQDESRLLRGKALEEALQWSAGRELSSQDAEFLRTSQAAENWEVKQANQILAEANQKAKWRLQIGTGLLSIAVVAAAAIGIWSNQTITEVIRISQIEKSSNNALKQFEVDGAEVRALKTALYSAYSLKQLTKSKQPIKYPTSSPIVALKTMLDRIRQRPIPYSDSPKDYGQLSPQGNYAIVASDNKATLWNLQSNQLTTLVGHHMEIQKVAFSPNEQIVATTAADCSTRLWNLKGKQLAMFERPQGMVEAIQFSPDSKFLIVAETDSPGCYSTETNGALTARMLDLQGKQHAVFERVQISPPNQEFYSVQFSPKGDRILTLEDIPSDKQILKSGERSSYPGGRLWNLKGKLLATFKSSSDKIVDAQFSPDGESIAIAENTGTIRIKNLQGVDLTAFRTHQTGKDSLRIRFSPDGRWIATGGADGIIELWNRQNRSFRKFAAYGGQVLAIRFSPDSHQIAMLGKKRTEAFDENLQGYLWDLQGNQLSSLPIHTSLFRFSSDGQHIFSNSILYLRNPHVKILGKNYGRVSSMQFNSQGNRIVTYVLSEGVARIWDNQGRLLTAFTVGKLVDYRFFAIKFDANGNQIYTRHPDNITRIWNLKGQQVATMQANPWVGVNSTSDHRIAAFTSDTFEISPAESKRGAWIARRWVCPDDQDRIEVMDPQGNQLAEYQGYGTAFSPDGQQIAIVSEEDNTPRIYRVEDLDGLLKRGCEWLKFEIVSTNNDSAKQMCDL